MSDQQPPAWNPDQRPNPPYGAPPPQYSPPPQYGQQLPYGGQLPPYNQFNQPPGKRSRRPWLLVGAVGVVVALIGGAVVLLTRGDSTAEADAPVPTATFTDAVTTPTPTPSTETLTPTLSPTPSPTLTSPERRRTLKDVDTGIHVYDDVYVKPVSGWTSQYREKSSVLLKDSGRSGVLYVQVDPVGYAAGEAAASIAKGLITGSQMTGVQQQPAKTRSPVNSNVSAQAEVTFSGRIRTSGVSVSLVGRGTSMTGVESVHNVTVTVCVEARKDARKSVFRDGDRMLASVARSI